MMRRWLSILLLVLLPLQFSWAVVAAYCQHETGGAAQHWGHHDHQHKADANHDDSTKTKPFGAPDNDCSACHASCIVALPTAMQTTHHPQVFVVADAYRHGLTSPPSSLPERPNWMPLA